MRILLVEDDHDIAEFVQNGLQEAGYAVDHTADGEEGYRYALNEEYGAAVVDLMLPRRGGLDLIQSLRERGVSTPVLILSAKRSVDERVEGLRAGGEDDTIRIVFAAGRGDWTPLADYEAEATTL